MKWVIADYEEVIFDLKGIVSVYKYIYIHLQINLFI